MTTFHKCVVVSPRLRRHLTNVSPKIGSIKLLRICFTVFGHILKKVSMTSSFCLILEVFAVFCFVATATGNFVFKCSPNLCTWMKDPSQIKNCRMLSLFKVRPMESYSYIHKKNEFCRSIFILLQSMKLSNNCTSSARRFNAC